VHRDCHQRPRVDAVALTLTDEDHPESDEGRVGYLLGHPPIERRGVGTGGTRGAARARNPEEGDHRQPDRQRDQRRETRAGEGDRPRQAVAGGGHVAREPFGRGRRRGGFTGASSTAPAGRTSSGGSMTNLTSTTGRHGGSAGSVPAPRRREISRAASTTAAEWCRRRRRRRRRRCGRGRRRRSSGGPRGTRRPRGRSRAPPPPSGPRGKPLW